MVTLCPAVAVIVVLPSSRPSLVQISSGCATIWGIGSGSGMGVVGEVVHAVINNGATAATANRARPIVMNPVR
jgi:hypothetical protein